MNPTLFLKEFKRNAANLISWSVTISILIFVTMVFFRSFIKFQSVLSFIPDSVISAFGFSLDSFTNVLAYYVANNIVYIMLLGSIYAIILASNIVAKEEYDKTAEFLFAKPITRLEIISSKFLVFFSCLLILNIFSVCIGFASIELFKTGSYNIKAFLIISIYMFLLTLTCGSLGLFISVAVKRPKSLTSITTGLVLIFYFIDAISKIDKNADKFGYISPFKYVNLDALNPSYGFTWWRVLYFIGISALLTWFSFLIYKKKDILI